MDRGRTRSRGRIKGEVLDRHAGEQPAGRIHPGQPKEPHVDDGNGPVRRGKDLLDPGELPRPLALAFQNSSRLSPKGRKP